MYLADSWLDYEIIDAGGGEELERWIIAHCKRKWNCDFSREMTRSAAKMIQEWREGK